MTLPREFANCDVTLEVEGDEVRIRKAKRPRTRKYSLKQLLAGITPDNIHPEFDTGPPVGGEIG